MNKLLFDRMVFNELFLVYFPDLFLTKILNVTGLYSEEWAKKIFRKIKKILRKVIILSTNNEILRPSHVFIAVY